MARKNIFQQLAKTIDFAEEIERLEKLIKNKNAINIDYPSKDFLSHPTTETYCIEDFVNICVFKKWKCRRTCIDVDDMRTALGLDDIICCSAEEISLEDLLNYLEFVSNIINLVNYEEDCDEFSFYTSPIFDVAVENINSLLNTLGYEQKVFDEKQMVLIVEKNEATTAVAEIVDEDLAYDVIQYNHYILKGDIEAKKAILIKLGSDLEAKRKSLNSIYSSLEDDIFYLLNNINIRHNNRTKSNNKKYHEYVAKMKKAELESWYDELYQMILLAFLELDQEERNAKVKELKEQINGSGKKEKTDGQA